MPNLMLDDWAYKWEKQRIQRLQEQIDEAKERYRRENPNLRETKLMDAGYRLPITIDAEVLLNILHEKLSMRIQLDYLNKVHAESAGWNTAFPIQRIEQYPATPEECIQKDGK